MGIGLYKHAVTDVRTSADLNTQCCVTKQDKHYLIPACTHPANKCWSKHGFSHTEIESNLLVGCRTKVRASRFTRHQW